MSHTNRHFPPVRPTVEHLQSILLWIWMDRRTDDARATRKMDGQTDIAATKKSLFLRKMKILMKIQGTKSNFKHNCSHHAQVQTMSK